MGCIVFENSKFKFVINEGGYAESLVLKSNGEELLADEKIPFFTVTQERPFNNEIKLIYMNKRTTYPANRIRREGDKLIVGFELAPYEAAVAVTLTDSYISFTLEDFIVHPTDYDYLKMDTPPAVEFRLAQIPVKDREKYGKWLNVMWDDGVAVNLLATSPYERIDSEERRGFRILSADAVKGIKLRGCTASLIVSKTDELLDAIDALEVDYGMPRGVKSRRGKLINSSIYRSNDIMPDTVDRHIAIMKKAGLKLMTVYYVSIYEYVNRYSHCNGFKFRPEYPEGLESLRKMLDKIKAAGITPGIHFLHTHIGMRTSYVTPHADRRLNLTRKFTLSKPLSHNESEIYVDENPTDTVMHPDCRVLKFGTELIGYEGYTTEPPYRFVGCVRGYNDTEIVEHPEGQIGGVLDITEYSATSVYLDQNSDLQDEIADKLAELYSAGFEFAYFDGSEGTPPPYEFHVPNAQYRVYKKFPTEPLFCEGAAKAHFSWHILSGANAFDVFKTYEFKEKLAFPVTAAAEMKNDFTRVNFGWWDIFPDTYPNIYDYGMSRAVAWDCPTTICGRRLEILDTCPLLDDNLEALRRWETAKHDGFFTEDVKKYLRETKDEHTLIVNENGEYELCKVKEVSSSDENMHVFVFERGGASYASLCYVGEGVKIKLGVDFDKAEYFESDLKSRSEITDSSDGIIISVSKLRYLKADMSIDELSTALKNAAVI
ncbi:MAG: hypothetical protein E7612_03800 [Ruminococcaceae bacterium]|nr:hypothetical protein [Oscillospiraceae bacterium]